MKRRGRKCASGESAKEEPEPELEPPLLARQPLLDMVLRQANPKGGAELFLRCFQEARAGWKGGCADEGFSACLSDPFFDVFLMPLTDPPQLHNEGRIVRERVLRDMYAGTLARSTC